ncbi:carbohydrate ABC transporter permease [Paenactinomyces guangxiensis]|uniref:Sugar ABC transporter permease n=1 Tax=Paenactinomyces guangxiensis TaxID=1490290 RepID=A0A7W1WNG6_9BACL|nr:sugar ABC transporter permease [Paenactinomyces guangxiensis]MBA4493046.1 sugar ABC transporter permease [Paenactinomyces guangxiensis]MBH8590105.1 sugar ABC transporter permease [Paenactinomyces guangxiensis]
MGATIVISKLLMGGRRICHSKKVAPYLFIMPFVLSFLLFFLYPLLSTINMSFQEIFPGETRYIGLANYEKIWNPHFYRAVYNTSLYTLGTLIILIPVPLLLAILLNRKETPGRQFFRSALFIPALTSVVVAGVVFRLMFGVSDTSLINSLLIKLGLSPQQWTMHAETGMFLMLLLATWRWTGVNLLYFLAGLQNIPKELYQSADIDGAGPLQKFWHITLPMLKPVVIYVLTISIFGGFRMFEESYVFWGTASPGDIGLTITGYLYQQGFESFDLGLGAAIGVVLLLIVLTINLIQLRFFGLFSKEDE